MLLSVSSQDSLHRLSFESLLLPQTLRSQGLLRRSTPEVSMTAPAAVVAPLSPVTPSKPQGQATTTDSALPQAALAIESTEQT